MEDIALIKGDDQETYIIKENFMIRFLYYTDECGDDIDFVYEKSLEMSKLDFFPDIYWSRKTKKYCMLFMEKPGIFIDQIKKDDPTELYRVIKSLINTIFSLHDELGHGHGNLYNNIFVDGEKVVLDFITTEHIPMKDSIGQDFVYMKYYIAMLIFPILKDLPELSIDGTLKETEKYTETDVIFYSSHPRVAGAMYLVYSSLFTKM